MNTYEGWLESRDESDAASMRTGIETCKAEAERSKAITAFVETPAWHKILLPLLDDHIRRFQEIECWDLEGSEFLKAKGSAHSSAALKDFILARVGKYDIYMNRATEIGNKLQKAIELGKVKPGVE